MEPESNNQREWRDMKRQAGCVWGCLTEPFVLMALAAASLFGAYSFGRKAERARRDLEREHEQEPRDE